MFERQPRPKAGLKQARERMIKPFAASKCEIMRLNCRARAAYLAPNRDAYPVVVPRRPGLKRPSASPGGRPLKSEIEATDICLYKTEPRVIDFSIRRI
jgi:hypothetical protein